MYFFFHQFLQKRQNLLMMSGVILLLFIPIHVGAEGNIAIAQQFRANGSNITPASLVSIQGDKSDIVELSKANDTGQLIGVVSNKPLVELSDGESGIQVVTNGTTLALISDINGVVKSGDRITASPIAGVGMKALENTVIVGTAQGDLDSVSLEERQVSDKAGRMHSVRIGLLPVHVNVAVYTPAVQKSSAFVPLFLQNIANNITGRDVSPLRVLIAALILFLLFVSITVLLYSAVHSSIISIGRNPLSENAVRRSLIQVGATVLAVTIFSIGLTYIVLTI